MELRGVFKNYNDLKAAYNVAPDAVLDETFDAFLKIIAGRETFLIGYNPKTFTFQIALINSDGVAETIDPRYSRFGNRVGIDKLASVTGINADKYIYCKNLKCNFIIEKDVPHDYEPKFTYGDIYAGNCTLPGDWGTKTGEKIHFKVCEIDKNGNKTGRIFCPECRSYQYFDEVSNTLP